VPGSHWLIWDDKCWVPDVSGKICELAKQITSDMIAAGNVLNNEDGRNLMKWGIKCQSSGGISAMVKLAQSIQSLVTLPAQLDTDDMLLAVQNGTLNLRTGVLGPHRSEDLITKILPCAYDSTATCPRWEKFLDRILGGDGELTAYVQRAVGYTLTASCREQCLFILHGEGKNGKSTFTTTLQAMLGSYSVQASETLLLENRGEHTTEIVDLMGSRLAVCSETPAGRFFNENRVKSLTGGDTITGHRMHRDNVSWKPSHKFWICTNNRPNLRELTEAVKRRIKLIPFDVKIPESERDLALDTKLKAELPGILAWAVRGCLDWQQSGLQTSTRVEETTAGYFHDQDSVARFVAAECIQNPDSRCGSSDLYRAYDIWARENVEGDHLTQTAFSLRLNTLGYASQRIAAGNVRKGLTLRPIEHGAANVD
jgi:putative DNA primase/helicase